MYGFPFLKLLPTELEKKCDDQDWDGLEIRVGLKEGKGVFTTQRFSKHVAVCNYGGRNLTQEFVLKHLLPFDDKCDYLVELKERSTERYEKFYIDVTEGNKTFGQLLNHSSRHPNVFPKVYVIGPQKLDIIFTTLRIIDPAEELVWHYGDSYSGVEDCVSSCKVCRDEISN